MAVTVKVDFNSVTGIIKPMHAVGGGPRSRGASLSQDATEIFKEIGVPSCRLHDIESPYGSNQFVDIHCIFPDFSADENDDRNYNFTMTDKYLTAIKECGADIFYRLGETIDHYALKLYITPPKDYPKWARICEHIIRHYNQGWANGYYMNLKYWEIWNEPESRGMWRGSYEEFYELYAVTATHLKNCFPDLKIGGYSAVGFYAATRDWDRPWFNTLLPFMDGFFKYIKEKDAPLDFLSWHCYALSPEEVREAAEFARKYLNDKGYIHTESILTEFNMFYSLREKDWPQITLFQHTEHAADILAAMIEADNSPLDMLFYYDLRCPCQYNGVFYKDYTDDKLKKMPGFFAMKFYGNLYRMKNKIKTEYPKACGIYAAAACSGDKKAIALSDRGYEGELIIELTGGAESVTVTSVSGKGKAKISNVDGSRGRIVLQAEKESVYYLEF